ncbi:MAG TPA: ATP-binding protein [Flavisolibacter sp.]|nr:ATP-binding protein [Flavisolibacter sp.]
MESVLEFFRKLFDTSDWPPRWHCGNWTEFHGWLYIVSDLLIWSAYFAIPLIILKYVSKRVDTKFVRAYFLFAAFILACGSTHLLDAIAFWFPAYRLNALVKFFAGVISWVTVFHIFRILPVATSLPTHATLEKEIKDKERAEEDLRIANNQLNIAQEIARIGHWEWNVPANKVAWSRELYKIYGVDATDGLSYEKYLAHLHPEDKDFVNTTIQQAFANKVFPDFTHRIKLSDGTEKIIQARGDIVTDESGNVVRMIGTAQDITDAQKAQQQIVERSQELENTNAELQKFAYVASHDLQEPLRKIMTFTSLLERELNGNISDEGKAYMQKIVQSSGRMQHLIDDILQFSSLRATGEAYILTDLNSVVKQVLSDMEVRIQSTGAVINVEELPAIEAIPSQMGQLFQNLISNAVKFKRDDEGVQVDITCRIIPAEEVKSYGWIDEKTSALGGYSYSWSRERFARIVVKDNGIGFNESYAEKIFEIFQRLHSAKTYEGTGIGLAICKKIVDNHHGIITASGQPGKGAAFTIILPLSQKNFLAQ